MQKKTLDTGSKKVLAENAEWVSMMKTLLISNQQNNTKRLSVDEILERLGIGPEYIPETGKLRNTSDCVDEILYGKK